MIRLVFAHQKTNRGFGPELSVSMSEPSFCFSYMHVPLERVDIKRKMSLVHSSFSSVRDKGGAREGGRWKHPDLYKSSGMRAARNGSEGGEGPQGEGSSTRVCPCLKSTSKSHLRSVVAREGSGPSAATGIPSFLPSSFRGTLAHALST